MKIPKLGWKRNKRNVGILGGGNHATRSAVVKGASAFNPRGAGLSVAQSVRALWNSKKK